jgi:hypothetical protein
MPARYVTEPLPRRFPVAQDAGTRLPPQRVEEKDRLALYHFTPPARC